MQLKQVGIILCGYCGIRLVEMRSKILSTYRNWGVKGVKVDFMQRADQEMVSSYRGIAGGGGGQPFIGRFSRCLQTCRTEQGLSECTVRFRKV